MKIKKNYCGYFTIIGKTNTGKSTLLNKLVKKNISMVSNKKHTTRNTIIGVKTKKNKQKIFIDTPGINSEQKKMIDKIMNKNSIKTINNTDIIIFLLNKTQLDKNDLFIINKLKKIKKPIIIIINKIDKIKDKRKLLPYIKKISQHVNFQDIIPVSVKTGENINKLKKIINNNLSKKKHFFSYKYITNQSKNFLISEIIRKKIIFNLFKELPYSIHVELKHIIKKNNIYYIKCSIWVEKKSQKKIIIGRNGNLIKKIKIEAKKQINIFLNKEINLNLTVNVKKKWKNKYKLINKINLN
ncbi:GTPase Era [Candidatus Purcelliella pentastirinorum]|uniref:GTPase Era n=1 Tax=Candidatus Purcelliella pentastirinorum TaxID=472834 RepID=A0A346E017_9ENTR|nr:GTPase Era [Candidatus Purcelliella pentastirinorum]AXN02322.1 GTP-binding protein Era [Candidatus Purcelliella pentastirinorum]WDI78872.1 GTPase Era [Candidatus Purcelliella pentastirinorum]WDR80005.1 GTPase Era [Candidatus Purcelliella pentastirinorum]